MKGNQLDYTRVIENLDNSYDWDSGYTRGITTLGIEYLTNANKNKSIKTSLGFSATEMSNTYVEDQIKLVHGYKSSYLNFRLLAMHHFKNENKGLRISVGPSIYRLLKHEQTVFENFTMNDVPSSLKEMFNKTPVYLDIEISYSVKPFELLKLPIYFEFSYSPQLKINGYINGNSKNFIMPRGLILSLKTELSTSQQTQLPKTPSL